MDIMPRVHLKLNSGATDDGLLDIVETRGTDPDAIVRRFDDAPEVRSHDIQHSDAQSVSIRALTPVPEGYRASRVSGTPLNAPAQLQNGWLHTEVTAAHERLSQFADKLAAAFDVNKSTASGVLHRVERRIIKESALESM
ncbi:hypothetical protein C440_02403 [Haloferax mucosum ATCC BAA-1512]|uniref:Uncharacterized protein n=1 Tax=Haloferax mucosum ATCC BAA-1512 TaxID=662479 RepID=M0IPW7_9EURY|nr:hypothetical protein [Haloferax mucosum]ELZ98062.1 hypothetical protein C440_02403 [Haloferax mucosum ATCC BAA-1512]